MNKIAVEIIEAKSEQKPGSPTKRHDLHSHDENPTIHCSPPQPLGFEGSLKPTNYFQSILIILYLFILINISCLNLLTFFRS